MAKKVQLKHEGWFYPITVTGAKNETEARKRMREVLGVGKLPSGVKVYVPRG